MSTQVETMSVQDVANKLVELSREGKLIEAIHELYDDNVVCAPRRKVFRSWGTRGFDLHRYNSGTKRRRKL